MFKSAMRKITDLAQAFLQPKNSTHRQYEALRAFFVERLPSAQAAARFGYSPGSFRILCHQFRQNPDRDFFLPPRRKAPTALPPKDSLHEQIVALRKQNLSIYDISRVLAEQGQRRSPVAVSL